MQDRRVLIVDDEANIRLTLLETLASMDVRAETAENGKDALRLMEDHAFDLVLLDLKMPGMSGMEVLQEVARRTPDVPVVMITAHGDVETAVEAMQAGAATFIQKPFTLAEIRKLVTETLDPDARSRRSADRYAERIQQAKACIGERRLESALEHARQAVALAPSRPEPFNIMGVAAQLQMQVSEAQKYYRSALSLDEGYEPARKNLENLSGFPKKLSRFALD